MYDMYVYVYNSNPETECKERRGKFNAERTMLKQKEQKKGLYLLKKISLME